MYTIPTSLDIKSLEGQDVQQIGYSSNVIVIYLVGGDFIQIMGAFSFESHHKVIECVEIYPLIQDYGLLVLLDKQIINIESNDKRDELIIKFTGNHRLTLKSDDNYESFSLKIGCKEVII